ncbi:hypothetical protein [Streptomyces canus]|uniref:hypothetical protein n=1 Tax=Streptomyces canus TaxID=58343 RepID=UPI003CF4054E
MSHMVLDKTDHPTLRDTAGIGLTKGERILVADSAPGDAGRTAYDPRPYVRSLHEQPVKWLIGVPFRPGGSRVTWMYYVVDEAVDGPHAVHAAMERANSAQERRARGGIPVTAEHIEVQRITRDAIGRTSLDGCPGRVHTGRPAA